jgi:hypothetical protein
MVFKSTPRVEPGSDLLETPDRIVQHYDVVYIDKERELRYPEMVDRTLRIVNHVDLKNDHDLIVDGTGVGEAAVDYMRDAGMYPIPIVFTNGNVVSEIYADINKVFSGTHDRLQAAKTLKEIRVPKKDLVTAGSVVMQQGRIHFSHGLMYRQDLEQQLMGFQGKVNEMTRHTKYEAEDEETHDDLVVVYLQGCWWLLNRSNVEGIKERPLPASVGNNPATVWEPADYF